MIFRSFSTDGSVSNLIFLVSAFISRFRNQALLARGRIKLLLDDRGRRAAHHRREGAEGRNVGLRVQGAPARRSLHDAGTGEEDVFSRDELNKLLDSGEKGNAELVNELKNIFPSFF